MVVLPYLAIGKYRLSQTLGSRALRADSLLTVSGIALAAIALAGIVAQRAFGWWWADPVAGSVSRPSSFGKARSAFRDAQERPPPSRRLSASSSPSVSRWIAFDGL